MGASQEKKRRRLEREQASTVVVQEAKKEKKKMSTRAKVIIAIVVVAIIFAAAIFFTSDYFYQHTTAVKIGDTSYSITDFNYYYWKAYNDYAEYVQENYEDSYTYYLPSTSVPFDEQDYDGTQTWDEFLENTAFDLMKELTFLYEHAVEDKLEISKDGRASINSELDELIGTVVSAGYTDEDAYLASAYGKGMDLETYQMNLERYTLAQEYARQKADTFDFDQSLLEDYYAEMKDTYDVLNFRYFTINVDTSAGESEEKANDNAYYAAQDFMKAVASEEDFMEQALLNTPAEQKATYNADTATLKSAMAVNIAEDCADYIEWLLDASRKEGDMEVAEGDGCYTIVYFISRSSNDYDLVNVRHIMIQPEQVFASDYENDDAGFEAAEEASAAAALKEAQDVMQEWLDEGGTEEQFAALADEHSDDNAEGGLYENVYDGQMVAEFNDWIYDSSRKPGDYDIIQTDYGYHVMYFVGHGMRYCDYIAKNDLGAESYNEWYDEVMPDYEVTKVWAFSFTK